MVSPARLLLLAYGPFPGVERNPTRLLADEAAARLSRRFKRDIHVEVDTLPVVWNAPAHRVGTIVDSGERWSGIIGLGVAKARRRIEVERVGYNATAILRPDAEGELRDGGPLVEGAPEQLEGVTHRPPFDQVVPDLRQKGHLIAYSDDPGRYLCNALLYHLLWRLASTVPLLGFCHVPHVLGETAPDDDPFAQPQEPIVDGLVELISGYRRALGRLESANGTSGTPSEKSWPGRE